MAGVKRKEATGGVKPEHESKAKKLKASPPSTKSSKSSKPSKPSKLEKKKTPKKLPTPEPEEEDDVIESDTTESENGFYGFSAKDEDGSSASTAESEEEDADVEMAGTDTVPKANGKKADSKAGGVKLGADGTLNSTSSKEAHAKQKALAKERKAAKPNADSIARSKKIWERLRRKSHVPLDERKTLVNELFEIITGKVKDFVFKHDSVRVVQCALKYANMEQRKIIARELKGDCRSLAESRYAKFLIGKMLVEGGDEVRDMVVPEFYGHVRRMINHPEASWILDDIYRTVATPQQKSILLREWYGPEFAIFRSANNQSDVTSTLSEILAQSPEKRKTIMNYLQSLINQLIQKKLTGFTMLHDAMLQYFLNTQPGTTEATEFLELLQNDEEEGLDLLKNLAFTKSGSRVVCLALAYATSKDRRHILRAYKDVVELLAHDAHGHTVLLAAYDVVDDTRETSTRVFAELLGKTPGEPQQQKVLALATHLTARAALLYPFAGMAKWLLSDAELALLREVQAIRTSTSKKNPETRRLELVKALSGPLLATVAAQAPELASSSFGCQFIAEVLLGADPETDRTEAVDAVAELAAGDPGAEDHIAHSAAGGRMLKTLVQGGRFDPGTKTLVQVQPPLRFAEKVWPRMREHVVPWATGPGSFVVVALVEAEGWEEREGVLRVLRKERGRLEKAAKEETEEQRRRTEEREKVEGEDKEGKRRKKKQKGEKSVVGNAGARLLLEKLG